MIKNLVNIQAELKCSKSNYNSFGKYRYRSAEDILTAVKPLLAKYEVQLTISDDIVMVGDRYYVKSTATLTDVDGNTETATSFAREALEQKGLSAPQVTAVSISFCHKYLLGCIFLIDDSTADADSDEMSCKTQMASSKPSKLTKAFLKEHGSERISGDEIAKLKKACLNAGESMSLERALTACKKSSIEEITFFQYVALMNQLGAVA